METSRDTRLSSPLISKPVFTDPDTTTSLFPTMAATTTATESDSKLTGLRKLPSSSPSTTTQEEATTLSDEEDDLYLDDDYITEEDTREICGHYFDR